MDDGAGLAVRDWEEAFNASNQEEMYEQIIAEKDEIIDNLAKELAGLKLSIREAFKGE